MSDTFDEAETIGRLDAIAGRQIQDLGEEFRTSYCKGYAEGLVLRGEDPEGAKAQLPPRTPTDLLTVRPTGGFDLISADPPWRFQTWSGDRAVFTTAQEDPYPTMTLAELKALPVRQVAAKDCLLHMWIVDAVLPQALELGAAWGFRYVTRGFTWLKGSTFGGGFWTRKQTEISLLFSRGKPKRLDAGLSDYIDEPRREHSRKPEISYHRLEQLVRARARLDLFARQSRPGWTTWGLEARKFDENSAPTTSCVNTS